MSIFEGHDFIKYLLSLIGFLSVSNLAIVAFFLRKYMAKVDKIEKDLDPLITEHKIFHKKETGIK